MNGISETDFYSAFLHELNQPVTSLRNGLELTTCREDNDWPAVVEAALTDVDRLVELLDLMGELRRFERALVPPVLVDLAALLRELLVDLEAVADADGISLKQEVIPAAAWIKAAAEPFRSTLFRILADALYHARQGQQVKVSLRSEASEVSLDVTYPGVVFVANESEALLALARTGRGPRGGITRRVFRLALALRLLVLQGARLELQTRDSLSVLRVALPAADPATQV